MSNNKPPKNPRTAILKQKRELKKKILGTESTHQRIYTELSKTKRAIKVEALGSKSKSSKYGEATEIENFVEAALKEAGVEYKLQKRIRYINVDFFVPSANLVVQANGCYYHSCPICYKDGLNDMQKKSLYKDEVSHKFIAEAGFGLLEVWEHQMDKEPEKTKKMIIEKVKPYENRLE